jgi:hypothetical protein
MALAIIVGHAAVVATSWCAAGAERGETDQRSSRRRAPAIGGFSDVIVVSSSRLIRLKPWCR